MNALKGSDVVDYTDLLTTTTNAPIHRTMN